MPQIKNKITKHDLQPPQSGKLLDLPPRRGKLKTFVSLVALVLIAGVAFFLYKQFKTFNFSTKFSANQPQQSQPQDQAQPEPATSGYAYITNSRLNASENGKVYSYTEAIDQTDKTLSQYGGALLGKYIEPNKYVIAWGGKGKIKILDARTGDFENFIDLDSGVNTGQIAISKDKKWMAYARNYVAPDFGGEIWLYNFETKEDKLLVKREKLGPYQGFSVLGWRDNDQQLVLSALGGNAGALSGSIYSVDVATAVLTKLEPVEKKDLLGFIQGQLSPNGDMWLYPYCADAKEDWDLNAFASCNSGKELRTYNFKTQKIQSQYHNQRFADQPKNGALRNIWSFLWQDDFTIIAAVPGAALDIKADATGQEQELFTYDQADPIHSAVKLWHADRKNIVFSKNDDVQIYNRMSEKISTINLSKRNEYLAAWLD